MSAVAIQLEQVPRLNPMFRLQWEKAQDCWVLLYPEGMVKLNASAGAILTRVKGEASIAQLIEQLQAEYPEAEDLAEDVLGFFQHAQALNWILYD
ncbi:pyrroloquinoline quinone biosynthesis peptide chaperone PqqD [Nitrincola tapanii]|uniref:PqqA binding protein n=1 Tax=Nitrincola tapanii TaxID=1708751 RepID=A0A5A9W6G7_9GAMM|nr:pyrroloquinoline quinone biosynthesis peptide chaperone PqqD [Nitrincola tapanii]KAA0876390.1 pyrroloquinoline quinone biosynthesis peptide chaperone PqqD [Nitrincola tapanii]